MNSINTINANNLIASLTQKIRMHQAKIGIIGLGYVGLPLVIRFCEENFRVSGFDIDQKKVERLNKGKSYIKHIPSKKIKDLRDSRRFEATSDYSRCTEHKKRGGENGKEIFYRF
jgi:UDP-N-acetyl-D-glucosamine dehydrogenase